MPEKPLHVRVAEALGCKPSDGSAGWECTCKGRGHAAHTIADAHCHSHSGVMCERDVLARYDTDWGATGPLIEKYKIDVFAPWGGAEWEASSEFHGKPDGEGPTPLIAVCRLILKLEGKFG